MTMLQRLYAEQGQSPWLDNLTRGYLQDGTLTRMVGDGIRGVTANPTIFARAIEGSADNDEQFSSLLAAGCSADDAYWGWSSPTSPPHSTCCARSSTPPVGRTRDCQGEPTSDLAVVRNSRSGPLFSGCAARDSNPEPAD